MTSCACWLPTRALGAALPRSGDGRGAQRRRTHQGGTGDAASDAGAAAAGVGGGSEGLAVTVHRPPVQAGVAHGAAGVGEDRVGALDRAGPPLAAHHLILWWERRRGGGVKKRADSRGLKGVFLRADQAGAGGAAVGRRAEGRARLIFLPQVATESGAEWAALAGGSHRVGAGNTGTRRTRAHHSAVLCTKTVGQSDYEWPQSADSSAQRAQCGKRGGKQLKKGNWASRPRDLEDVSSFLKSS